jgi:hypothetical protein
MENFKEQLGINFSSQTRRILTEAIQRGYETALDAYDEGSGSNANTFGYDLYWFCAHELSEAAQETDDIELISERPEFRLRIGAVVVACHRVGSDHEQDISVSFPNNNRAAGRLARSNAGQLSLPFESGCPERAFPDELKAVLAHIGNPGQGLGAVYLCVPVYEKKGRIRRWGHTELLWKAEEGEKFAGLTNKELPEEVPIEPAVVRLKTDQRKKEADAGDI